MKAGIIHRIMFMVLSFFVFNKLDAQTNLRGLVILIDFSDHTADIPLNRVNDVINTVGYTEPTVKQSLRDYWFTQSRGKVQLTHEVIGYFRAPKTAAWYQLQTYHAYLELCKQALDWVSIANPGFDWNSLSLASGPMNRNGTEEGTFLSINFFTTAWIPGTGGTHWLTGWTAPNGVSTQQITGSDFMGPWDSNINLFWVTHEQGHSIWGWPDTYDTNGLSRGTGSYTVMSGNQGTGEIEPVGAPFLVSENWVNVIDITDKPIILTQDGNTIARYKKPGDPKETFLIESRMSSTIGNAAFPVPRGLLLWHVDDNVTTSNIYPQMTPAQHYRVSVEQADGSFHLEGNVNRGDAGDIFLPGDVFNDASLPDAHWWNGSPSTLQISNIQFLPDNRISFNALSQICSAGNSGHQKVNVCHNNKTTCVEQHAVAQHLAHGDYLGPCLNTSTTALPIPEEKIMTGISVFPNPSRGKLSIVVNLPGMDSKDAVIQVLNSHGQLVSLYKLPHHQQLNIQLNENGVYFIRLVTDQQVLIRKVMVVQ